MIEKIGVIIIKDIHGETMLEVPDGYLAHLLDKYPFVRGPLDIWLTKETLNGYGRTTERHGLAGHDRVPAGRT